MPITDTCLPQSFSFKELRAALRFYRQLQRDGEIITTQLFSQRFRCSMSRASMLIIAAEFAARVQDKENKNRTNNLKI